MKHLLVTNDFPPKIGGIQSYLWELWRRLPPGDVTVFTSAYKGSAAWDAEQAFRVVRSKHWWLLPTPALVRQINQLADEVSAELILLDPALPLGLIGPHLNRPYVAVGHGAEIAIPARIPLAAGLLHRVMRGSMGLLAAGEYVADLGARWSSSRDKPVLSIPPGVDVTRFKPLNADQKREARKRLGLPVDATLVVGMSRLVRRKGFDRLIKAANKLKGKHPDLVVAIAGQGRDGERLRKLADGLDAPVQFMGRVPDEDLPALLGCADVFVMACHDRWLGLEREGFGIVFVEAAAAGVPVVAGLSGGSAEAVVHGETGLVVGGRVSVSGVADAMGQLTSSPELRKRYGDAGRARMEAEFSYEVLVDRLAKGLPTFL